MKSLTSKEEISILRQEERGSNGCLYRYQLRRAAEASLYTVYVSFCDADGYKTEQSMSLPFTDVAKAEAMFERLVRALATPIDLPYVLEDCFAV